MSQFWSPLVHRLTPYVPGEQPKLPDLVKLNTNENPYPPSPHVLAAMQAELGSDAANLRLYPDPNADLLKEAVAAHFAAFGIKPETLRVHAAQDHMQPLSGYTHLFRKMPGHHRVGGNNRVSHPRM